MQPRKLRRPGPAVALAALSVFVLSYSAAQGWTSGGITAAERADAEHRIIASKVVGRLEASMGDAFGGVWFEPSSGRLHVGVTSAASRRGAEAAAARAGVAELVVATPVSSTSAEIEAAQTRWAERMDDLFERAEVMTSRRAQYNALEVVLGASVPQSRRSALERAAEADEVNVRIETSPAKRLRVEPQARCAAFVAGKAQCDPTIVAGVTTPSASMIPKEEEEVELDPPCTVGPAVLPKKATDAAVATERRVLTAGHCVTEGKKFWFAYARKLKPELELIGLGSTAIQEHVADIGLIWMEPMSIWRKIGFTPVNPAIALWDKKAETEPIPVVGQQESFENAETCVSGQTSGTLCGKVIALGQTFENVSNMTEVNVSTAGGDSGAPWYAKSYAESGTGLVEGVHVGRNPSNNNAIFEPLQYGLEKLKEASSVEYVLLTESNEERRHPVATANAYPATVSAEGESEDLFTAFGATITCNVSEYDGELSEASGEIELAPEYQVCTTFGSLPVVFKSNGCKYRYELSEEVGEEQFSAKVDVVCTEEAVGLQFDIYASHTATTSGTPLCTLTIPAQTGIESVTVENSSGDLLMPEATTEGIEVRIHRKSFLCPSSGTEAESSSGVYDFGVAATLSGTYEGESNEIDIGGA